MLESAERRKVSLISREIISDEFQHIWSQSTNVTDGQTDEQKDRQLIMAIPRYATLRAVKTLCVRVCGTVAVTWLSNVHCVDSCQDLDPYCGRSPGYPPEVCENDMGVPGWKEDTTRLCPKQCGYCGQLAYYVSGPFWTRPMSDLFSMNLDVCAIEYA